MQCTVVNTAFFLSRSGSDLVVSRMHSAYLGHVELYKCKVYVNKK